jgi:LemA protein
MEPVLIAVLAVLALVAVALVGSYNRFVRQRTLIDSSWGTVDVELSRRHDLVPNLVSTVQGYAAHERAVLDELVRAREAATAHQDGAPAARAGFEQGLGTGVATVLARAEAYPELKASANFLALQQQLAETEDRIAAARRFYNLNVGAFNTRIATFPSNLVARSFGFAARDFFELDDPSARRAPTVSGL